MPTGTHASSRPAAPAGNPRSAAYGTSRLSAPVTNAGGSHIASSSRRTAGSASSSRVTCQLRPNSDRAPSPAGRGQVG